MSVYRYNSIAELIAHLGPMELKLYNEFGRQDYVHLMEMWACVDENKFDSWYDNTDPELAEHILDLSSEASHLYRMYDSVKLLH
jgi:hypothetical protein